MQGFGWVREEPTLQKSQCPQWSFALQGQPREALAGQGSWTVAMPSMVFRAAGALAASVFLFNFAGRSRPSMVFRAGGTSTSRCPTLRQQSRNALNGLSRCRGQRDPGTGGARWCRNALNGLSRCRRVRGQSEFVRTQGEKSQCPHGLSRCRASAGPSRSRHPVLQSCNALNGLSPGDVLSVAAYHGQWRVAMPSMVFRAAGSFVWAGMWMVLMESQCPQWSFALQGWPWHPPVLQRLIAASQGMTSFGASRASRWPFLALTCTSNSLWVSRLSMTRG
jgi:hypothetical protein